MTRFRIRERCTRRALRACGKALDRLDPPPDVEDWVLFQITQEALVRIIVPVMAVWPKKPEILPRQDQPHQEKAWRRIDAFRWTDSGKSWANGSYLLVFGHTYGIHFGNILSPEGYGVVGSLMRKPEGAWDLEDCPIPDGAMVH